MVEEEQKEKDISELLIDWNNIKARKQSIEVEEKKTKDQIKAFLKERKWDRYLDKKTNISITITEVRSESIDKTQLKLILNNTDYQTVVKTTIYERMNILTKEARKKLKKMIR